jgi:transcriptional regulator with XRE-family HTH domain
MSCWVVVVRKETGHSLRFGILMQNRIGILRLEKGLSLTDLAKAAGTTKAQIQKLERGERRLSLGWMERLARALDVKMSDLLPQGTVACQHGPEEREILDIVSQLPMEDRVVLVRIANELLETLRRWEGYHSRPRATGTSAVVAEPRISSLKRQRAHR